MNLFGKKSSGSEKKIDYIEIDGIKVIGKECSDIANDIVKTYRKNEKNIAKYLFENGMEEKNGDMDVSEVIIKLGMPCIYISQNRVSYPYNELADEHIISFEYSEGFEKVFNIIIDG